MSREIKFRGLSFETKEWVYGYYAKKCVGENGELIDIIIDGESLFDYEVAPETVGQFTGLRDKKRTEEYPEGQEGWDGDRVRVKDGNGIAIGTVIWHKKEGQWYWQASEIDRSCVTVFIGQGIPLHIIFDRHSRFQGEVVHENPELLE